MTRTSRSVGERALLDQIRRSAAVRRHGEAVRIGIGDDCAVLSPRAGEEVVITTDFSLEGRHFRRDWHSPEAIGHKCLARGLSDIAAMGARPLAAFVSLAVPPALIRATRSQKSWLSRFYDGLLALGDHEKVPLAGGDLSESPSLAVADIVVLGAVAKGRALLRSTAKAGDILYVTGSLGGAVAELNAVERNPRTFRKLVQSSLEHPHLFPQPRLAAGRALLRRAHACIDISDGLSVDLLHLCEESDLSAEVDAANVPLAVWQGAYVTLDHGLHGGDDYELLFTASPSTHMPRKLGGVDVHAIGRMLARKPGKPRVTLLTSSSQGTKQVPLKPLGWQSF